MTVALYWTIIGLGYATCVLMAWMVVMLAEIYHGLGRTWLMLMQSMDALCKIVTKLKESVESENAKVE